LAAQPVFADSKWMRRACPPRGWRSWLANGLAKVTDNKISVGICRRPPFSLCST
jgi:hypothetical protein